MKRAVTVKQDDKAPVTTEVMAQAIVSISQGIKALRSGRLNDKALLLLIQHAAPSMNYLPIPQKTIRAVLEGIESLETTYLKKR